VRERVAAAATVGQSTVAARVTWLPGRNCEPRRDKLGRVYER